MPSYNDFEMVGVGALPQTLIRYLSMAHNARLTLVPHCKPGTLKMAAQKLQQPDLIVLTQDGPLHETRRQLYLLAQTWPDLPIMIFSFTPHLEEAYALFAAGARGYLEWPASQAKVESSLRCVLEGSYVCGPGMSSLQRQDYEAEQEEVPSPGYELSPQELTLVTLIAEHHTNESIADVLGLAEKTVEYHLRNLFKKLGVRSRKEVGAWWLGRIKGGMAHPRLN